RSDQRQHQSPHPPWPWLYQPAVSPVESPTPGCHEDRIHRPEESRMNTGLVTNSRSEPFFRTSTQKISDLIYRDCGIVSRDKGASTSAANGPSLLRSHQRT